MKLLIPTVMSLLLLTACTSYKEGFDCEAVPGVGCHSISEVDKMIDEEKLGVEKAQNEEIRKEDKLPRSPAQSKGVHVWIAPYTDEAGITHSAQNLFVPIKPNPEGAE